MYSWNASRCRGESGRVSRNTTTWYGARNSRFRLSQFCVDSNEKWCSAAIRANHGLASFTKLMCAASRRRAAIGMAVSATLPCVCLADGRRFSVFRRTRKWLGWTALVQVNAVKNHANQQQESSSLGPSGRSA